MWNGGPYRGLLFSGVGGGPKGCEPAGPDGWKRVQWHENGFPYLMSGLFRSSGKDAGYIIIRGLRPAASGSTMRFLPRFLLLCLLFMGFAHADDEATPTVNSHGIKVWTYDIPNYPVRGFRATTVVKSSLGGLVNLITDTDNVKSWVYHVDKIDMVKRDNTQQTFIIHAFLNFWPLKNRDAYIQGKVSQDPHTLMVSIDSAALPADSYPAEPGMLRMSDVQGHWGLRPLGDGMVEVTMSGRGDPGGDIPKFLINLLVQENPYNTLLGLKEQIGKYQGGGPLKQIREPGQ